MTAPPAPDSAEFEAWLSHNRALVEHYLAASSVDEDDDAAWDALWDRVNALHHMAIAEAKRSVFRDFACDPRRSALHGDHPDLLDRACDIETPIVYEPAARTFFFCGHLGEPRLPLLFDIHTGRRLPEPVVPPRDAAGEWWAGTSPAAGTIFPDEGAEENRGWIAAHLPPDGYDRSAPAVADAWHEACETLRQGQAQQKETLLRQLGLDPRRSALFDAHPALLCHAAAFECPLLYTPDERRFSYWTNGGPAVIVIDHDPFTGRRLPPELGDAWSDEMERRFGEDYWDRRSEIATPPEMDGETWWRDAGL